MVAPATRLRLVLFASSALASCVIVTERPVDSAPPPAPAAGDPATVQPAGSLVPAGGSPNKPLAAAALAPAGGGASGAPQTPPPKAAGAGAPGLGAAY
jgi:hypothetical protein